MFWLTDIGWYISIYADDAVIFLRPDPTDITLILDILQLFGKASGL
jgi:hypothetical protein